MEQSKQNRAIKKVAVLGSGVMGSGIALHFANIGVEVLLLDIVPFDLKEEEKDFIFVLSSTNESMTFSIDGQVNKEEKKVLQKCFKTLNKLNRWLGEIIGRMGGLLPG